jgi:protein-disulfide isomerase
MADKDYLEIKVPKLQKPKQLLVTALVVLVMILSFGLGAMYMKLQNIEQNGNNVLGATNTQPKTLQDQFSAYAKQIGLQIDQFKSCFTSQKYLGRINAQIQEGSTVGVAATPTFFINGKMLAGAYPIEQFRNVISKELDGTGSTDVTVYDPALQQGFANAQQRSFDPTPKDVSAGDAPVKGSATAPVTIIEYSDFQCPFCERAFPTVNQIMSEYKGKVRLVYKQYPLTSIHPLAMPASLASECAREQGKFWEYHDLLFQNQSAWVSLPAPQNG